MEQEERNKIRATTKNGEARNSIFVYQSTLSLKIIILSKWIFMKGVMNVRVKITWRVLLLLFYFIAPV